MGDSGSSSLGASAWLQDLQPCIEEILRVSGAAGASVGILDGPSGQSSFAGYRYRDIWRGLTPDEHTVYHIASLSKSFTAAAIGLLVADGKLSFDDRMRDIVPGFHHPDKAIDTQSTLLDFLSHRTGLASKDALWQQDGHELLLEAMDTLLIINYLEVVAPLGKQWTYNNFGYDVLADVITRVSGSSWAEFVYSRIFKPLGMHETTTSLRLNTENWAQGYMSSLNGELKPVGRHEIATGTVQQAANAVKSTASDLPVYYKAVLDAWRLETHHNTTSTESDASPSVLRHVQELVTPHIPITSKADNQWYGAGWAIAELPAPLGSIGTNGMFIDPMPLVGRGYKNAKAGTLQTKEPKISREVLRSGIIIVVLVNSKPLSDTADWIGQMLLEHTLDCPEKNDYVVLAQQSAAKYADMWAQLSNDLQQAKAPSQTTRPLPEYTGRYYNKPGHWFVEVSHDHDPDGLSFSFQGRRTQSHKLKLFGKDVFSWALTEAESRTRGRWPDLDFRVYIFRFGVDDEGRIGTLTWVHDPDVPEGEVFVKHK